MLGDTWREEILNWSHIGRQPSCVAREMNHTNRRSVQIKMIKAAHVLKLSKHNIHIAQFNRNSFIAVKNIWKIHNVWSWLLLFRLIIHTRVVKQHLLSEAESFFFVVVVLKEKILTQREPFMKEAAVRYDRHTKMLWAGRFISCCLTKAATMTLKRDCI